MKNSNTIPTRVDPALKKFLDDIRVERFRRGKDKSPKSPARISLAITRVPRLRDILLEANIND
jgi:hypothetical protein